MCLFLREPQNGGFPFGVPLKQPKEGSLKTRRTEILPLSGLHVIKPVMLKASEKPKHLAQKLAATEPGTLHAEKKPALCPTGSSSREVRIRVPFSL